MDQVKLYIDLFLTQNDSSVNIVHKVCRDYLLNT